MKKERYLISDLKLDTAVAYSAILSLRVTSGQGEHGSLSRKPPCGDGAPRFYKTEGGRAHKP